MTDDFDPGFAPGPQEIVLDDSRVGTVDEGQDEGELTESVVRGALMGMAAALALVDRHPAAPDLWRWTDDELAMLAPALCRAAERNPTLKRALMHGDAVTITLALSSYAGRNLNTRRKAHALDRETRPDPRPDHLADPVA